jgi:hypothetical protein
MPVMPPGGKVKFKSDFTQKFVIAANFERRGWVEVDDEYDPDWDICWGSVVTVRALLEGGMRLRPTQIVSHFPNSHELTRKVGCNGCTYLRCRKETCSYWHMACRPKAAGTMQCVWG